MINFYSRFWEIIFCGDFRHEGDRIITYCFEKVLKHPLKSLSFKFHKDPMIGSSVRAFFVRPVFSAKYWNSPCFEGYFYYNSAFRYFNNKKYLPYFHPFQNIQWERAKYSGIYMYLRADRGKPCWGINHCWGRCLRSCFRIHCLWDFSIWARAWRYDDLWLSLL